MWFANFLPENFGNQLACDGNVAAQTTGIVYKMCLESPNIFSM
jgi:hypothetical protein